MLCLQQGYCIQLCGVETIESDFSCGYHSSYDLQEPQDKYIRMYIIVCMYITNKRNPNTLEILFTNESNS